VYVSGAPGAGKTSLAVPLAAELGYALISKDIIKEALHDALGAPDADLVWSRRLGGAAMELLWTLAARAPEVVLEANFRPYSEFERNRLSALAGTGGSNGPGSSSEPAGFSEPVSFSGSGGFRGTGGYNAPRGLSGAGGSAGSGGSGGLGGGSAGLCRAVEVHCVCPPELASARYNARPTHPVHVIKTLPVEAMAEYDRPVGIGALVTVDTTRPVDVAAVAGLVRAAQSTG